MEGDFDSSSRKPEARLPRPASLSATRHAGDHERSGMLISPGFASAYHRALADKYPFAARSPFLPVPPAPPKLK